MDLDFSKCETAEDVKKVLEANKKQLQTLKIGKELLKEYKI